MAYNHRAVGTLTHVDGLLDDPAWANGSSDTLLKIYDTIEQLSRESNDAEKRELPPKHADSERSSPCDTTNPVNPMWTVSAWPSPGGAWFVVHHRPTTYTIRTQSLDRLQDKIIRRFQPPDDASTRAAS